MQVSFAALANAANVAQDGNLNVLGVFDSIGARFFPTRHSSMVLAFRLRFEYDDQHHSHSIKISLLDADHRQLWNAAAEVKVGDIQPGAFAHTSHIISFRDTVFPKPGRYKFRFSIGEDVEIDAVVFQLLLVPTPASE